MTRERCEITTLAGTACREEGAVRVRTVWGGVKLVCDGHRLDEDVAVEAVPVREPALDTLIQTFIADLDTARAEGIVYTFARIRERLHGMLSAAGDDLRAAMIHALITDLGGRAIYTYGQVQERLESVLSAH